MSCSKLLLRSLLAVIVVGVLGVLVCCDSAPGDRASVSPKQSSGDPATSSSKQDGDEHVLVESRESTYNNIFVYRAGAYVSMSFGHNQRLYEESRYNTADDRELPEPYTVFMTASLMYPNKITSILEIGSGGGRTAWYLHRCMPKVQVTTVELDPVVIELSRKYFGIRDEPNFREVARDGRVFLANSKDQYDVILIDAYRGPFAPFHMLTKEFYQIVKSHLAEGGVMAQNVEPSTMLFDSSVKTLHAVFPQIEFYESVANLSKAGGALTGAGVGPNVPDIAANAPYNAIAIAYQGEGRSRSDLSTVADKRQSTCGLRYSLQQMLPHRFLLKEVGSSLDVTDQSGASTAGIDDKAKVLTDDFAPAESLKAIARHNQKWTFQQ